MKITSENDLPRRTWRQWWMQTPSWFRIVICGFAALVALHGALAARMAIGLQESSTVAAFRQRGVPLYFWQERSERFRGEHLLASGFWGRRPVCVTCALLGPTGSKEEIQFVVDHFVNIRYLDLTNTDVGDADLQTITSLKHLRRLSLSGTQITDAAIPLLQGLPHLESLDISWTLVSPSRLRAWTDEDRSIKITTETTSGWRQSAVATIRWADGQVCERFPAPAKVFIDTTTIDPAAYETKRNNQQLTRTELSRQVAAIFQMVADDLAQGATPDDHTMMLKLRGYESDAVPLVIREGKLATRHVEFRMPVTLQEALTTQVGPEVSKLHGTSIYD